MSIEDEPQKKTPISESRNCNQKMPIQKAPTQREQRLAENLRANLRRRKTAMRKINNQN